MNFDKEFDPTMSRVGKYRSEHLQMNQDTSEVWLQSQLAAKN